MNETFTTLFTMCVFWSLINYQDKPATQYAKMNKPGTISNKA